MKHEQLFSRLNKWFLRKTLQSGVRRVAELPFAIGSDVGCVREQNQDRVAVLRARLDDKQSYAIVAVCDGMGGMVAGSDCAARTISAFFVSCVENAALPAAQRLALAASTANRVVNTEYQQRGGATLSAVLIDNTGQLTGINVGDSRIYCFNNRTLTQLTVDDTIAGQLSIGAESDEQNKQLVQYIGLGQELEPHVINITHPFDLICITTDGLHVIGKSLMQMLLTSASEPVVAVKRMVEVSKWCGGFDNASMAVVSRASLQQGNSSDIGVVEVWDSFGELQIIAPVNEMIHKIKDKSREEYIGKHKTAEKGNSKSKTKRAQRTRTKAPELFSESPSVQVIKDVPIVSATFGQYQQGKIDNE